MERRQGVTQTPRPFNENVCRPKISFLIVGDPPSLKVMFSFQLNFRICKVERELQKVLFGFFRDAMPVQLLVSQTTRHLLLFSFSKHAMAVKDAENLQIKILSYFRTRKLNIP